MTKKGNPPMPAWLVEPEKRGPFRAALTGWFAEHGRDLPWRRTRDPYAVLVSELMLQQTQVVTVLPYYRRWLERFPDAASLARAPEAEVLRLWEGLGYYARARNLHRAARVVTETHGGQFPRDLAGIAALPGVGRYTAGAVASFAFDLSAPLVDANVARVLARLVNLELPIDAAAGQRALWWTAETLVPPVGARLFNSALMELGALVCRARAPQCLVCPVRGWCGAFAAGAQGQVPVKKAPRATVALDEPCAWIVADGGLLLQQGAGTRWKGLWKLPPLTVSPAAGALPLFTLVYPFTHHAVTLRVFPAPVPASGPSAHQRWWPRSELESVAMAAPHRRVVRALLDPATGRQP